MGCSPAIRGIHGALFELGRIANTRGDKKAAADCLRKAIASEPDNGKLYNELGFVLIGLGDRQQALGAFMRALEINPCDPDAINNMGAFHLGEGRLNQAVAAQARAGDRPRSSECAGESRARAHERGASLALPMMNNAPRNSLYDEAIGRVVPGRSVLDIGTGSGLLSMMAARAGAKWVVSCDGIPWIAAKATEVVAANGLSDRIKIRQALE